MNRYLRIYRKLLSLNLSALMAYRANFVNSLISSIAWAAFSIFSMILLTSRTPSAYGWTRNEIILLTGSYNIIVGIFHMIFSRNFQRFSNIVHFGHLDALLTKPVDSQFLLSFWLFNYTSGIRVVMGIVINAIMLSIMGIHVQLSDILLFSLFTVMGIVLLYSIWFTVITFTIWFTRLSNLVDLLYSINGVTRFPPKMVSNLRSAFSYVLIPLTFVVAPQTRFLIQRTMTMDIFILLIMAVTTLMLSRTFFRFALRYYASGGN